jgi:hypothetical protein
VIVAASLFFLLRAFVAGKHNDDGPFLLLHYTTTLHYETSERAVVEWSNDQASVMGVHWMILVGEPGASTYPWPMRSIRQGKPKDIKSALGMGNGGGAWIGNELLTIQNDEGALLASPFTFLLPP